jgi:hypothetical protein
MTRATFEVRKACELRNGRDVTGWNDAYTNAHVTSDIPLKNESHFLLRGYPDQADVDALLAALCAKWKLPTVEVASVRTALADESSPLARTAHGLAASTILAVWLTLRTTYAAHHRTSCAPSGPPSMADMIRLLETAWNHGPRHPIHFTNADFEHLECNCAWRRAHGVLALATGLSYNQEPLARTFERLKARWSSSDDLASEEEQVLRAGS